MTDSTPHRDRLDRAVRLLQSGELPEAETLCQEILAQYPDCADAHHLLSHVHARRGDPARATASLNRAILAAPTSPDLHMSLATMLMNAGDF
ncbi:MAG: tetratricopeptide repeat protein, partial [Gammaproteobacteria bacterium]|nr:tetratricopeptide repeat protein [Gammaproteobacteria bacterium]